MSAIQYLLETQSQWAGNTNPWKESLSSMCKALGSVSSTKKGKREKERRKEGGKGKLFKPLG